MKLNRQKVIIFNYNFKLTKDEYGIIFYVAKQLSAEALNYGYIYIKRARVLVVII